MYLKTFEDMKKTSVFFMLKSVNAIYGFIVTVSVFIVLIILWSFFAPMDDVVKADVILRPVQAVSVVRCVSGGELFCKKYENDDIVSEGDLLFSLDTQALKTELESYVQLQKKNNDDIFIYTTLLQTIKTGKISGVQKESDAWFKSNEFLLEKSRYETVLENSRLKYEREKDAPEGLKIQQNITDALNQYTQTKLSCETWMNSQNIQTGEKILSLESEKKNIESRISELQRTIKNSTIYAPISGRISETVRLNPGDYILSGEEVLKIVPQNNKSVKAELYVDSSDAARVKIGDKVKIKFPGLSPGRYGFAETKVSIVPPDSVLSSDGKPVFIVEAVIENPYLRTRRGQEARLLPGISGQARIIIERCSVFQMVIKKLDFKL